ncbi:MULTISPECIES: hypothetical protein [Chryseobacterium]|uniref:hypothetical protein n=1 Tax=Chryseobacterium TaxID=59732 RepID=UPI000F501622|nr:MULTISPECIES: hypothetical protein [Chryseobacterium]AZB32507.1 hypothetical protein EG351_01865 [Chryseobacterium bernardetii]UCA60214.1 hypothetical protein KB553_01505 [Chryseobacterium rhizoplanae]
MKRKFFLLFSLMSQVVFSQVGINTPSPTKTLDVNGDMRIRNVSSTNSDNIDFLVKDNEGNISSVSRSFFSQSVSGVLSNIFYLQGTNPVTINVGSTSAVPGLAFNYTIKKGEKKILLFTINGSVRAEVLATGAAGQGIFGLFDENNAKITSGYANFSDIVISNDRLLNAPFPVSFQKQVIIDNSTGSSDITKTYIVKYTAWATKTTDVNKAQIVNFIPSSFAGYDNDTESLLSKMTVLVFNMN